MYTWEYVCTITKMIFHYAGLPQVKISQSFRRATFLTHTVGSSVAFVCRVVTLFVRLRRTGHSSEVIFTKLHILVDTGPGRN